MKSVSFVDPQTRLEVAISDPAHRPGALAGLRVGFVDNSKLNADLFIDRLVTRLQEAHAMTLGARIRKLAPKDRLTSSDLDSLRGCDVVVQCFGDCGTSTSMTIADSVVLELDGIPTATVISTAFRRAAGAQAAGHGMPALPIVEIPHPMHTAAAAQVTDRADSVIAAIEAALTGRQNVPPVENSGAASLVVSVEDPESFFAAGWTDGLPVVPPTRAKVDAMVATVARDAGEAIGPIPPRMRTATIEQLAANAVLAGCLPEYFPVVLTALEALLEKDVQLYGIQTATNMTTPLLILNGPIVQQLDVNACSNAFGQGWRANATIGRAVQLILRNLGGDIAGETDMSTQGWAGKFTFCVAENEAANPWTPFHVDAGYRADESTVTVMGGSAPQNIFTYGCDSGADVLEHIIGSLTALGNNNIIFPSGPLLALSPEHAHTLARDGYSKTDLQREIFLRARIPLDRFAARTVRGLHHRRSRWFETVGDPAHIGVADRAEDVYIIVVGGAGIHSQFIPTGFSYHPVTRPIVSAR